MRFIVGQSDSIGSHTFTRLKYFLSAISVALTSGFVFMLEAYA